PRPIFSRRDLDVRIGLVVAEADVVARAILLDEGVLEEERLEIRPGDDRLDVAVAAEKGRGLGVGIAAEVGRDALLQGKRLADVQDFSLFPLEQVDPWRIGQIPGGVTLHHEISLTRFASTASRFGMMDPCRCTSALTATHPWSRALRSA